MVLGVDDTRAATRKDRRRIGRQLPRRGARLEGIKERKLTSTRQQSILDVQRNLKVNDSIPSFRRVQLRVILQVAGCDQISTNFETESLILTRVPSSFDTHFRGRHLFVSIHKRFHPAQIGERRGITNGLLLSERGRREGRVKLLVRRWSILLRERSVRSLLISSHAGVARFKSLER